MLSGQRSSGVRDISGRRRVLIVDDNADSAELLVLVLARAGYELRVASTPAAALLLAPEFCPHLALIDIGLPEMDGHELLRLLRGKPELQGCRFIAVTGYAREVARPDGETGGFECHLTKPVDFELLLRTVASVDQALG
jgi:two-component system, sensor histidine kinase